MTEDVLQTDHSQIRKTHNSLKTLTHIAVPDRFGSKHKSGDLVRMRAPEDVRKGRPNFASDALIIVGIMKLLVTDRGEYAIVHCSAQRDLSSYNVS